MKKALIEIVSILVFLILYLLQANFFSWFTIAGIKPNLFVILVLFMGLFAGKERGLTCGVICGLLFDFFIGKKIGVSAIGLGIVGLLGGIIDKSFSKESKLTIMLMVAGSTIFYEIFIYIANIFIFSASIEIGSFLFILVIEVIYNAILTIILYPLLQRAGFYIEDVFKGNKILTRYF